MLKFRCTNENPKQLRRTDKQSMGRYMVQLLRIDNIIIYYFRYIFKHAMQLSRVADVICTLSAKNFARKGGDDNFFLRKIFLTLRIESNL